MGSGNFQSKDKFNSRGYYEDLHWRLANQRITGKGYSLQAANVKTVGKKQRAIWRRLARQYREKPLWGVKDPWFCFVGQFVWTILRNQGVDVRLVAVHRDREASIASVRRHLRSSYGSRYGNAAKIVDTWQEAFDKRLDEWDGQVYQFNYEELVEDTEIRVELLINYCFKGLAHPSRGKKNDAVSFVTDKLKHF